MIVNYVREAIHMATVNPTKLVSCAVLIPKCSYRDFSSRITRIEEELERPNIIQEPIMLMASTTSDKFKGYGSKQQVVPELVKYLTDASICLVTVSKNPKFSLAANVFPHYSIVAPPIIDTLTRDGSEVTSPQQPITLPQGPMNSPQTPHPITTPTQEETEEDLSIIQDDPSMEVADASQYSDEE